MSSSSSSNNSQNKYPPYWKDDRSENQKLITLKLTQKLSQINHSRKKPMKINFKNVEKTLFVLIGGVPPNKNQFIDLKFPGKVVSYRPPFFHENQNQENKLDEKQLKNISMDNTCGEIKRMIQKEGYKSAVFVYHSFGGSITAWFCSLYPQFTKGLICLGGTPIRFYPIIRDYTKAYLSIPDANRQMLIQNYQMVYSLYDQKTKNQNNWTRFKNKYQLLSFTLHNDPTTLNKLFDKIRKLPLPILMIYGNKDEVLTKTLCAESMIYMSYLRKQDDGKVDDKIKERYGKMHGEEIKDKKGNNGIQEKLVYFIEGGHSIHISSKNNKMIQPLIDEYLFLILGGQIINNNNDDSSNKKQSQISAKL